MSDINLIIGYQNGNLKDAANDAEKTMGKAGKKSGSTFSAGFLSAAKGAAKAVAAIGAAVAAVGSVVIFKSIGLAKEQEEAVNSLNTALKITGKFSQETSEELQAYASSLQAASKFGDEAILSSQALIQSLGNLDKNALKGATQAALDMASALKIDLRSAATLVGKAAAGEVGSFSRYGVAIKKGANNAETFSNALTALNSKFGGAAEGELNTYAGAVQQASNSFGDMLEKVGDIIIKNPLLIKAIKSLGPLFDAAGEKVVKFGTSLNVFDDLLEPLVEVNNAIITYVVAPLELLANIGDTVFKTLVSGVSTIVAAFGGLGLVISDMLTAVGLGSSDTAVALRDFAETSAQVAEEAALDVGKSASKIFDFGTSSKLAEKNEDLRTFFQDQRAIIEEESAITDEITQEKIAKVAEQSQSFAELLIGTFDGVSIGINKTKEEMQKTADATAKIVKNGLAKAISGGIQNIATSLAKGEDVFANFGKFLLGTIGDLAIQLGTFFIAEGLAVEALEAVSGTGTIAAGVALVALGSLINASIGGGGGASASASSGGSGGGPAPSFASETEPTGEFVEEGAPVAQASTVVNFNIEGNVKGDEQFIREIVEDIGTEGGKQGLVFDNFSLA